MYVPRQEQTFFARCFAEQKGIKWSCKWGFKANTLRQKSKTFQSSRWFPETKSRNITLCFGRYIIESGNSNCPNGLKVYVNRTFEIKRFLYVTNYYACSHEFSCVQTRLKCWLIFMRRLKPTFACNINTQFYDTPFKLYCRLFFVALNTHKYKIFNIFFFSFFLCFYIKHTLQQMTVVVV